MNEKILDLITSIEDQIKQCNELLKSIKDIFVIAGLVGMRNGLQLSLDGPKTIK